MLFKEQLGETATQESPSKRKPEEDAGAAEKRQKSENEKKDDEAMLIPPKQQTPPKQQKSENEKKDDQATPTPPKQYKSENEKKDTPAMASTASSPAATAASRGTSDTVASFAPPLPKFKLVLQQGALRLVSAETANKKFPKEQLLISWYDGAIQKQGKEESDSPYNLTPASRVFSKSQSKLVTVQNLIKQNPSTKEIWGYKPFAVAGQCPRVLVPTRQYAFVAREEEEVRRVVTAAKKAPKSIAIVFVVKVEDATISPLGLALVNCNQLCLTPGESLLLA